MWITKKKLEQIIENKIYQMEQTVDISSGNYTYQIRLKTLISELIKYLGIELVTNPIRVYKQFDFIKTNKKKHKKD